jgi:hypothetical protein
MPLPPSLPLLTPEEIASFVANGFLVKRSILSQALG